MKTFAAFALMMVSLTGCNSAALMNQSFAPGNPSLRSFAANPGLVTIVEGNTTVLNKQMVIQKLMNSQLSLDKADIFDKKNVFRIEFSNGRVNTVPGFLRMYLTQSGASEIQLVGNFYTNQPVQLSKAESAAILKSAGNYQAHRAQLDGILK